MKIKNNQKIRIFYLSRGGSTFVRFFFIITEIKLKRVNKMEKSTKQDEHYKARQHSI